MTGAQCGLQSWLTNCSLHGQGQSCTSKFILGEWLLMKLKRSAREEAWSFLKISSCSLILPDRKIKTKWLDHIPSPTLFPGQETETAAWHSGESDAWLQGCQECWIHRKLSQSWAIATRFPVALFYQNWNQAVYLGEGYIQDWHSCSTEG